MCLILFAVGQPPSNHLVIAANRDEYYARPSSSAAFWEDRPDILGGRDLSMGGTWMGLTRNGRFAAVTNFRETPPDPVPPRSRGDLTSGFLTSEVAAADYLKEVAQRGDQYRGFNLIVGDGDGFFYFSNNHPDHRGRNNDDDSVDRDNGQTSGRGEHKQAIVRLAPGYYGLSNQLLNCNWPKVSEGRDRLRQVLRHPADESEKLFGLLSNEGDGRAFSNSFISSAEYGTCAQTVIVWRNDGSAVFEERTFASHGRPMARHRYELNIGT
ncbi:MAG: NRDE family protein [Proteobacteria bacterium]|jgi:uncharacterized protein with NRDE domain|nr:NRDE family protein [Pseudomonadota bacterium]